MRGHAMHENREISAVSIVVEWIGRGKRTAYEPNKGGSPRVACLPLKAGLRSRTSA
jgi:hypothetical protein